MTSGRAHRKKPRGGACSLTVDAAVTIASRKTTLTQRANQSATKFPARALLGAACLGLWLGIMGFGLWPFNFHPRNRVEWLPNTNGLHFNRYGEAYSLGRWNPTDSTDPGPALTTDWFTIELWMRSRETKYSQVSGLVSIVESSPQSFSIAQSGPDILVRGVFEDATHHAALRKFYIDDAFPYTQPRFITVTSGPEGTQLYLDGVPGRHFPVTFTADNFAGRILLGHNFYGHQHWNGDLLGLAVYRRSLTRAEVSEDYTAWQQTNVSHLINSPRIAALYLFDERSGDVIHNRAGDAPDISIPPYFSVLHKTVLGFSGFDRASLDLSDIVINIAGFAPLGFFLCAFVRCTKHIGSARALLLTVILGALTSLAIELLQVYLPSRESSLLDVIDNTLGTFAGAILQFALARIVARARESTACL